MIEVTRSPNADSRSMSATTTKADLQEATESHIGDVTKGLNFIAKMIEARGPMHDHTKMEAMDKFADALNSKHVKESPWYQKHITEERHHLKSHVPDDVNLIDVIEHVVDCTMAGLTRSGEVYDTDISPEVLQLAVQNTVELLKLNTTVADSENIMDAKIQE